VARTKGASLDRRGDDGEAQKVEASGGRSPSKASPPSTSTLDDLAARIRAEHEAFISTLRSSLEHAISAGEMLIEAKARLKHGQWLPWLKDVMPERTASHYMRLARSKNEIGNVADLSVRGAVKLLTARVEDTEVDSGWKPALKKAAKPASPVTLTSEWLVASEEKKSEFVNSVGLVRLYELASDAERRQLEAHLPTAKRKKDNELDNVKKTINGTKGTETGLKFEDALNLMLKGSLLTQSISKVSLLSNDSKRDWHVAPGGPVSEVTAKKIRAHPLAVPCGDALFPGLSQTWRMSSLPQHEPLGQSGTEGGSMAGRDNASNA